MKLTSLSNVCFLKKEDKLVREKKKEGWKSPYSLINNCFTRYKFYDKWKYNAVNNCLCMLFSTILWWFYCDDDFIKLLKAYLTALCGGI